VLGEEALLKPGLKVVMDGAGGDAEPVAMDGLPLTAGPEYVPDAVEDGTRLDAMASGSSVLGRLGQEAFAATPERPWNTEVVDVGKFGDSMMHDVSSLSGLEHSPLEAGYINFCTSSLFSDRALVSMERKRMLHFDDEVSNLLL
jgi:hypothetical protein